MVTLAPNVVTLIKDLNGNHVIQRCLHRMSSENKQFIYNAVSENCIEVATHRHGCCVLQRCIDYSSESQKVKKNPAFYNETMHVNITHTHTSIDSARQWDHSTCPEPRSRSIWQLCRAIRP